MAIAGGGYCRQRLTTLDCKEQASSYDKSTKHFFWIFGLILYLCPVAIVFMEPEGLAPEWMLVSTVASVLGGILLAGYGLLWAIKKCLDFVAAHFSHASNID